MVTINPNVLNQHALNIVMKVSPTNVSREERISFFTWLDTWIKLGTDSESRKLAACKAIDQIKGDIGVVNTVVHRNWEVLGKTYYNRQVEGQLDSVGRVIDAIKRSKVDMEGFWGGREQLADLFNSITALLICNNSRDDVRKTLLDNIEPDIAKEVLFLDRRMKKVLASSF